MKGNREQGEDSPLGRGKLYVGGGAGVTVNKEIAPCSAEQGHGVDNRPCSVGVSTLDGSVCSMAGRRSRR